MFCVYNQTKHYLTQFSISKGPCSCTSPLGLAAVPLFLSVIAIETHSCILAKTHRLLQLCQLVSQLHLAWAVWPWACHLMTLPKWGKWQNLPDRANVKLKQANTCKLLRTVSGTQLGALLAISSSCYWCYCLNNNMLGPIVPKKDSPTKITLSKIAHLFPRTILRSYL